MKRKLTEKEEQIMKVFWEKDPPKGDIPGTGEALFIREVLESLPEPKPSYNTVATQIKFLEDKGFLQREPIANTFRYSVKISERQYRGERIGAMVSNYYDNSYASLVSQFVEEERMSLDELKALIARIENGTRSKEKK